MWSSVRMNAVPISDDCVVAPTSLHMSSRVLSALIPLSLLSPLRGVSFLVVFSANALKLWAMSLISLNPRNVTLSERLIPFYSAPPTYTATTALGIEVVGVGLPSWKAVGVGLPSWSDWIVEGDDSELDSQLDICRLLEARRKIGWMLVYSLAP